ncbi:MAG: PadR family transcriptional regulator [Actinomycetota bacterium]|nr:PadR family transcriptional regulator [Actinomycetota bacterium]
MAATDTRLLVLGAVCLFEPVNGYQVRRELLSWGVEDWAHINPGSIYTVLATLTRQGHLRRHDVPERARSVAVYTVTDAGHTEFEVMLASALETVDVASPLPFHVALAMVPLVPREQYVGHLEVRRARLAVRLDEYRAVDGSEESVPPHALAVPELWASLVRAELDWVDRMLGRVRAGDFDFRGEEPRWVPAADDPGWQMTHDRDRYRRVLGLG